MQSASRFLSRLVRFGNRLMGYECYLKSTPPFGLSECSDIAKMTPEGIRVVFDVGANIGDMTLRFATSFPDAKIYAFEPIPETFSTLEQRTSIHPQVIRVPTALGDVAGSATVVVQENNGINSLVPEKNAVRRKEKYLEEITVSVDTVDAFCEKNGINEIDLLKSDTEGFDLSVLKGAERMFEQHKVRYVLVECDFDDWGLTRFLDLHNFCIQRNMHFIGLYDSRISPPPELPRLWYTNALYAR